MKKPDHPNPGAISPGEEEPTVIREGSPVPVDALPAEPRPLPMGLSDRKVRAAELLTAGLKFGQVAGEVGVSREQLWRWRTQDLEFQRFLTQLRLEHHLSRINRVWTLGDKALEVVEESLDEGDPQAAMQLLRLLAPGLTDLTRLPSGHVAESDWSADSMSRVGPQQAQPNLQPAADSSEVPSELTANVSFKCVECGKPARSEGGLKRHMRARHGDG